MSSILKALKKLEQEKVSRKPDSLKIDAEILRNKPPRNIPFSTFSVAALLLFVCGSGAMYLYMKQQPAEQPIDKTSTPIKKDPPSAPPVMVVQPAQQKNETIVTRYHSDTKGIDSTPALRPSKGNPPKGLTPDTTIGQQTVIKPETDRLQPPPEPPQKIQSTPKTAAIPSVKVDGIAFQEGGADSMAVVNGVTVSRGSVVDGVTITEIMKDRVKLNYSGVVFEVGLGKSSK